jgi:hypothetical protein
MRGRQAGKGAVAVTSHQLLIVFFERKQISTSPHFHLQPAASTLRIPPPTP